MSKGSKARPYNVKQFGDNFDDIFNKSTDDEIHREHSEILMGSIRQSNEQKLVGNLTRTGEWYREEDSCGSTSTEQ